MEYFVVLFGMRYDKHWRHPKQEFDSQTKRNNNLTLYGNQRVAPIENSMVIPTKDVPNPLNIATTLNKVSIPKISINVDVTIHCDTD